VTGRRIQSIRRRGKHLIFGLDNGYSVMAHLMMRGRFLLVEHKEAPLERYFGLAFELDDGSECRYHDVWQWGEFRVLLNDPREQAKYVPAIGRMGQEPLSPAFSGTQLRESAGRRPAASIKAALLDQSIVAGIGNIYADESLFSAGIRPDRPVAALTDPEWGRLGESITTVLNAAVDACGMVSDEFVRPDGRPGAYVPQVYGRGGQPCKMCGTGLVRVKVVGRGTVYCPSCQS
jgi:formamidopyrimidine-DNA glycosylase